MGEQHDGASPVIVFCSYAHEDERLRRKLEKHLSLLQRRGIITTWHDRKIVPGTDWSHEIDDHLNKASLVLLLISPDFLASDYCYQIEMDRALERDRLGEARVIPVLLRATDWEYAPFGHLQALPTNAKPITSWSNQDEAFTEIAAGIRRAIQEDPNFLPVSAPRAPSPLKQQAQPFAASADRDRQRLLKRVRTDVEDMLEYSLYHEARIALGLQEQPDALENSRRLIVQETARAARPLPAGTRIKQVYDKADGELLILGEPGSGKTTLLLELTRDLLHRAEQDETYPMPVVFNLSSWAEKQQLMIDWLAEELDRKYRVPSQRAKTWLATDCILPLLDGLDEVAPAHRGACLDAINIYRGEHVVVCSRSKEYFSETARLRLRTAVTVQPLTVQQINDYLESAGEQLTALRTVLHQDKDLLKLAANPLFLSISTFAYREKAKAIEDLTTGTPEVRRRQIFADYVQSMLKRHRDEVHYTPQQTIDWLKWLASRMAQHHQTEFYLESMQPDWLWEKRLRRYYEWTVGRPLLYIMWALLHAVYSGLLAVLVVILVSTIAVGISKEVLGALLGIFPGGILISLVGGILYGWRKGLYTAAIGIPVGALAGALISAITSELTRPMMGLVVGLVTGVMIGLLASIIGGKGYSGIYTAPVFAWSWEEVRLSFKLENKELRVAALLGGVSSILVAAVVTVEKGVFSGLGLGGVMLLAGLLLFVLYSGVQSKSLPEHARVAPDQRIWQSARKGLYFCLAVGSCAFTVTWLIISSIAGPAMGWTCGLVAGVLSGIATGWASDWDACVRHLVLRVLLRRTGSLPRNYARFLDYAEECFLLHKIGGGYRFIHRLLLEYFALQEMAANLGTKDAAIYHYRGLVYAEFSEYESGYEKAIMNYTHAIELDRKEVSVYCDRGLVYAGRKQYQEAIADYTHAIELDPKDTWTYYQRGSIYRELKEYKKAIADFTQMIKLDPKSAVFYVIRAQSYHFNKEYQKAITDYTRATVLAPQDARFFGERGFVYADLEEYQKAITDYTRATVLAPQNAWFFGERGTAYLELQQYKEAIDDFTWAIELQPSNASLYSRRGAALLRIKAYDQAIADCTRATKLDPTYGRAYFHRGSAYLWLKKGELASADFVQFATLRPDSINAAWMVIYSNLGKQRPGFEIAESLDKIVAINPQSEYAQLCQGVALGLRNSFSDGIAALERSIQLAKSVQEDAYFWKGLFYTYLGQEAEATRAITQALEAGLPPVLLAPLHWLEQERPEIYQSCAVPFLVQYGV
jgi:tetratricopeptide (TPR) repeat protein/DNA polymerase III delta prime subunit